MLRAAAAGRAVHGDARRSSVRAANTRCNRDTGIKWARRLHRAGGEEEGQRCAAWTTRQLSARQIKQVRNGHAAAPRVHVF